MAKHTLQDIVIDRRKRKLQILHNGAHKPSFSSGGGGAGRHPGHTPVSDSSRPPRRRKTPYFIALLCFAFLLFSLSLFFVGATVTVYPKQKAVTVSAKNVLASRNGATPLHFETVTLSAKASVTAEATGQKEVKRKASGTIIVYNDYNERAQKLIKNTRFETADGKVYRIDAGITVPGVATVNGKRVPGSVEAIVYADVPGEDYNIGKTDFTLPGFKGDPRYTKFYARSKTDMRGGMTGNVYTISETDEIQAMALLEARLREQLLNDLRKNLPDGYLFYPDAAFFEFGDLKTVGGEGTKNVTVEKEGKVHVALFSRPMLSKFVAQNSIDGFDGAPVDSPTLGSLVLTVKDREKVDYSDFGTLSLSLSGDTTVIWGFDPAVIVEDLKGKPKKNFQAILARYPSIDRAELTLAPFWATAFPEDPADITVKTAGQ